MTGSTPRPEPAHQSPLPVFPITNVRCYEHCARRRESLDSRFSTESHYVIRATTTTTTTTTRIQLSLLNIHGLHGSTVYSPRETRNTELSEKLVMLKEQGPKSGANIRCTGKYNTLVHPNASLANCKKINLLNSSIILELNCLPRLLNQL